MGYLGGKAGAGVYQRIICEIPPHGVYIEPFLGGGAIMRLKRPAGRNIGVDRVPAVIASFGGAAGITAIWEGGGRPELLCGDALDFLGSFPWRGGEFVYCDPPYLFDVRGGRSYYACEFGSAAEHTELLLLLRSLPCMVAISGYWSELYADALADWRCIGFPAMTRGGLRQECLWMNYPEPVALHDYRYLGADYRERERIKRKTARWRARLEGMPLLERRALLSALAALDPR